jgi:hypothetical protein
MPPAPRRSSRTFICCLSPELKSRFPNCTNIINCRIHRHTHVPRRCLKWHRTFSSAGYVRFTNQTRRGSNSEPFIQMAQITHPGYRGIWPGVVKHQQKRRTPQAPVKYSGDSLKWSELQNIREPRIVIRCDSHKTHDSGNCISRHPWMFEWNSPTIQQTAPQQWNQNQGECSNLPDCLS